MGYFLVIITSEFKIEDLFVKLYDAFDIIALSMISSSEMGYLIIFMMKLAHILYLKYNQDVLFECR